MVTLVSTLTVYFHQFVYRTPDVTSLWRSGLYICEEENIVALNTLLLHLLCNFLRSLQHVHRDMFNMAWPSAMGWATGQGVDFTPTLRSFTENP